MYNARARGLLYELSENYLYQPDPTAGIVAEAQSLADLISPSEPYLAKCLRGMIEAICEQPDDALALLEEAAFLDPKSPIPQTETAIVATVCGQRKLALAAIGHALARITPDSNPLLLDHLTILAGYLGDMPAMTSVVTTARTNKIFTWILVNGAMACIDSENGNEADAYLHSLPDEFNIENLIDVELDLAHLDISIQSLRDRIEAMSVGFDEDGAEPEAAGDDGGNTALAEEALRVLTRGFDLVLKLDLKSERYSIMGLRGQNPVFEAGDGTFSDWLASFVYDFEVHHDDVSCLLDFASPLRLNGLFAGMVDSMRCRYRHLVGSEYRWAVMEIISTLDHDPENPSLLVFTRDVPAILPSDLKNFARPENARLYDDLTGLKNRQALQADCQRLSSDREIMNIGVIFAGLNGLGLVNDVMGHAAGDACINEFATRLAGEFRKESCYFLRGNEFAVLLANIGEKQFLERIETFKASLQLDPCTVSLGQVWQKRPTDIACLVNVAEAAMHGEKAESRRLLLESPGTCGQE